MSKLIDYRGPHTRQCRQPLLPQRLRRTKESHLSISVFEPREVTVPVPQVQALRQRSECWLVMVSGLVELRMLLLFRMTGLVDLVDDAAAASSFSGSFPQRPTLLRFGR